jgi:outer membrane protein assembly factor BamB
MHRRRFFQFAAQGASLLLLTSCGGSQDSGVPTTARTAPPATQAAAGFHLPPVAAVDPHIKFAFDQQGNAFHIIKHQHQVIRVDAQGNRLWDTGPGGQGPGLLDTPVGLSADSAGNIYVVDRANCQVVAYDASGQVQATIGGPDNGDHGGNGGSAPLLGPTGVLVAGATLLVCDSRNARVAAFDLSGNFQFDFAPASPALLHPRAIAPSPDGGIHVVDGLQALIHVYTPDGAWQRSYGDDLKVPRAISIDAAGNSLIADGVGTAIVAFDAGGTRLGSFAITDANNHPAEPLEALLGPDARLYLTATSLSS